MLASNSFLSQWISRRTLLQSYMKHKTRTIYASTPRHDLIGPPDPISHIRPILYDDPPSRSPAPRLRHPYSLSEFKPGSNADVSEYELQYKLFRQQLDSLHQSFWLDSNTRFYAAKEAVLSSLPSTAPVHDREEAISIFLKQWVMQEKDRADAYTNEWRKRNFQLIKIGTRVELHKLKMCIGNYFKSYS